MTSIITNDMAATPTTGLTDTALYMPGSIVELHSLSKEELNGILGECGKYNTTTQRQAVTLLGAQQKRLAIKCINLKRPTITSEQLKQADDEAKVVSKKLVQIRSDGNQQQLQQAVNEIQNVISRYPTCGNAHQILGDAVHMSGNMHAALVSYRRAAENGGGLHARFSLSNMLGETGDFNGEIQQLELLLKEHTEMTQLTVQALFNYGNILCQVNQYEKAFGCYLKIFGHTEACERMSRQPDRSKVSAIKNGGRAADQVSQEYKKRSGQSMFINTGKLYFRIVTAADDNNPCADIAHLYSSQLSFLAQTCNINIPERSLLLNITRANLARALCDLGQFDDAITIVETILQEQESNGNGNNHNTSCMLDTMANCYEAKADAIQNDDDDNDDDAEATKLYKKAMNAYVKSMLSRPDPAAEVGLIRVQVKMRPDLWTFGLSSANSNMIFVRSNERGGVLMLWNRNSGAMVETVAEEDGSIGRFPTSPAG